MWYAKSIDHKQTACVLKKKKKTQAVIKNRDRKHKTVFGSIVKV